MKKALYVLAMGRTRFRANPHSIVAWCSKQARNLKFKWLQLDSSTVALIHHLQTIECKEHFGLYRHSGRYIYLSHKYIDKIRWIKYNIFYFTLIFWRKILTHVRRKATSIERLEPALGASSVPITLHPHQLSFSYCSMTNAFLETVLFSDFFLKETLTLLTMLVETICNITWTFALSFNVTNLYYDWYAQKNF